MYGVIEYDSTGKPICEICRRAFDRVLSHVRQVHHLTEREYKMKFGFDLLKGICSKESSERTKEKTLSNFDRCVKKNLILGGASTRLIKGTPGRTKDKVSEQTRKRLKARLTEPTMVKAMQKAGQRVGQSGLGNKARWGTKTIKQNQINFGYNIRVGTQMLITF